MRAVDCISLTTLRQRLQYSRPVLAPTAVTCRIRPGTYQAKLFDAVAEIDSIASDAPSILASPQGLSLYSLTAH
ncbi:hypothetical protein KC338_g105 [Hortaea werneckii]|nr:hypothetical protein KC338_g105 [Hortaea werneckii]